MRLSFVLIAIAVLALGSSVHADNVTLAWDSDSVYFQVWNGSNYAYSANPWQYSVSNDYYFPSDFRFNYSNQWYAYYPSGWYYSYADQYYAATDWVWNGTYWYQPSYQYFYYPQNQVINGPVFYDSISPYTSTYSPVVSTSNVTQVVQAPSCGDIQIRTQTVYLSDSETVSGKFDVENNSAESFYISQTEWTASSNLQIWSAGYDSKINSGGNANIQYNAEALQSGNYSSSAAVKGYFASGKQCSFSTTRENFSVIASKTAEAVTIAAKVQVPQTFAVEKVVEVVKTIIVPSLQFSAPLSPAYCSDISLSADNVSVVENETAFVPVMVQNNSPQVFTIQSAIVQEDSDLFNAQAQNAAIRVGAQSQGSFNTAVNALQQTGNGTATLKVSGFFQDGNACSFNRIAAQSFTVTVKDSGISDTSGLNVKILAPEEFSINSSGSYWIAIVNEFDYPVTVHLTGSQANVDPQAVALGAKEVKNVLVTVSNVQQDAAWIIYDVQIPEREMQSSLTKIVRVVQLSPAPVPIARALNVQMNAKVKNNLDGSYDVNVALVNATNEFQNGEISLRLPSGWKAEGQRSVSLSPGESKSIALHVIPDKTNSETRSAIVEFVNSNGEKVSKTISFAPNAGIAQAIAAGFAVLGGNLFWLGVLVVVLLIVFAGYRYRQEHLAKVQELKIKWASH